MTKPEQTNTDMDYPIGLLETELEIEESNIERLELLLDTNNDDDRDIEKSFKESTSNVHQLERAITILKQHSDNEKHI